MPKKSNSNDINILLLGETGVGKSTFINSLANYLHFGSMDEADAGELKCEIPAKFAVPNADGDPVVLNFGKSSNEDAKLGNSSTQSTRDHEFEFQGRLIRVIDTPGINDTRGGATKDAENCKNILDYIGQFRYLHGVCVLLKPDVTSLTPSFKYCFVELMSRLHRSAAPNIGFVFTRTRSTEYTALETIYCLQTVLDGIADQHKVRIPLRYKTNEAKNCFYFDNECFNYLVARKHNKTLCSRARAEESWNVSQAAAWALVTYIAGDELGHGALSPHLVEETRSVNDARELIYELSKPLADLTENIQDNLVTLKKHRAKVAQADISAADLRKLLHVPVIDLQETKLDQPVTVCAATKCSEIYTVGGIQKYHYKTRCHNPCYLTGVKENLIGAPGLQGCWAMSGTANCTQCGCGYQIHLHVYYETMAIEKKIEDKSVQTQLKTNDDIVKAQYKTICDLEKRVKEYQDEHAEITSALAMFAHFLDNNSICPINDAYEEYLSILIEREKIAFDSNPELLKRYESLLKQHIEQKNMLQNARNLATPQQNTKVTTQQIFDTVARLKKLKIIGGKIATLHKLLAKSKRAEAKENLRNVNQATPKNPNAVAKKMQRLKLTNANTKSDSESSDPDVEEMKKYLQNQRKIFEEEDAASESIAVVPVKPKASANGTPVKKHVLSSFFSKD